MPGPSDRVGSGFPAERFYRAPTSTYARTHKRTDTHTPLSQQSALNSFKANSNFNDFLGPGTTVCSFVLTVTQRQSAILFY